MDDRKAPAGAVRIALLGLGTVGSGFLNLLAQRRAHLNATLGLDFVVTGILVSDLTKKRDPSVDVSLLTSDAYELVTSDDVDVVVELIGGIEPARSLCLKAIEAGKPVVTGNKELLATSGFELYEAADGQEVDVLYEAAAAAAIPIVRSLRQSLFGEDIHRLIGIVNGTTNYVLTRMEEEGADYDTVLADAQRLGYAEQDPSADVDGFDAAAKAAILASAAFGEKVIASDVYVEGISAVTQADISYAAGLNYRIKLVAIAERVNQSGKNQISVQVYPALVPFGHPLASVGGTFNAVFVEGGAAGELMFYGRGAGGAPTASAVLGDVVDAAVNLRRGVYQPIRPLKRAAIRPVSQSESAYYLNLEVLDSPGVLATVASLFGSHKVSIKSMEQTALAADQQVSVGAEAQLTFLTHQANEAAVMATVGELRELEVVAEVVNVMRVIGE